MTSTPTADRTRVVVTGLGATTPVGGTAPETWAALLAGRSGIRELTEDWAATLPVHFAGRVAVEPTEVLSRVEARRLDRSEQFALVAAREAWQDAGFTTKAGEPVDGDAGPGLDAERVAVVFATGIGGTITLMNQYDILKEKGARRVSPYTVPMLMPNGPAGWVSIDLGAKAGVHTPVSACASVSSTSAPAPSPRTKPSRPVS